MICCNLVIIDIKECMHTQRDKNKKGRKKEEAIAQAMGKIKNFKRELDDNNKQKHDSSSSSN